MQIYKHEIWFLSDISFINTQVSKLLKGTNILFYMKYLDKILLYFFMKVMSLLTSPILDD